MFPASLEHFPVFQRADVDIYETSGWVDERFAMFNVVRVQYLHWYEIHHVTVDLCEA